MNDHMLKNHFKGWSNEELDRQRVNIICFGGSTIELGWIEQEIKRRKEAEDVA